MTDHIWTDGEYCVDVVEERHTYDGWVYRKGGEIKVHCFSIPLSMDSLKYILDHVGSIKGLLNAVEQRVQLGECI